MPKSLSFNKHGLLPKGEHELTFKELRNSILVKNSKIKDWDSSWRGFLVSQAEILVKELWKVGITEVFFDGSFVEAKPRPNDIDGYFVCDLSEFASGHIERELNKLNKHKIWTWNPASRRSYRGFAKKQLPMWHKYRVELYPHYGQFSGIKDRHGNVQMFPAAFRRTRNSDREKGIVKILP